jgi:hypothetical protein
VYPAGIDPASMTDVGWVNLPGKLSAYARRALVYLPPQYGQPQYARVRFPVVELFHGTPGSPLAWDTVLRIDKVVNLLIAKHEIGPTILVMPSINGSGHNYQDCVNGPAVYDDTYLTKDVRADMFAHYRVSLDPYEWGVAGYVQGRRWLRVRSAITRQGQASGNSNEFAASGGRVTKRSSSAHAGDYRRPRSSWPRGRRPRARHSSSAGNSGPPRARR